MRTELERAHDQRRVRLLGAAVVAVGAIDVVSALTPALRNRLTDLLLVFTPQVMRAANGATAIFGVCLILLGRGLLLRRDAALWASVGLLMASIVTNVLKGLDVEEAMVAGALAFFLIRNRRLFTARPARTHLATVAWWVPAGPSLEYNGNNIVDSPTTHSAPVPVRPARGTGAGTVPFATPGPSNLTRR